MRMKLLLLFGITAIIGVGASMALSNDAPLVKSSTVESNNTPAPIPESSVPSAVSPEPAPDQPADSPQPTPTADTTPPQITTCTDEDQRLLDIYRSDLASWKAYSLRQGFSDDETNLHNITAHEYYININDELSKGCQ